MHNIQRYKRFDKIHRESERQRESARVCSTVLIIFRHNLTHKQKCVIVIRDVENGDDRVSSNIFN